MRHPLTHVLAALMLVVASSDRGAQGEPGPARPNVLLIVMDTVRADVLPAVLALSGLTRKAAA